jgi:hypothetical protein
MFVLLSSSRHLRTDPAGAASRIFGNEMIAFKRVRKSLMQCDN